VRSRLDLILLQTLGFAKEARIVNSQPVSWGCETHFFKTARFGRQRMKLSGRPDYALWYGDQENLETNLVIVEAKAPEEIGRGVNQLLAYMGTSDASPQRHR
jgi:hypothetical protein